MSIAESSEGYDDRTEERFLWVAVIIQAWADAFGRSSAQAHTGKGREARKNEAEAVAWLTRTKGAYAADRETVCWLAGFDPDWLRMLAEKRIEAESRGEEQPSVFSYSRRVSHKFRGKAYKRPNHQVGTDVDRQFAKLLADASFMSGTQIDVALERLAGRELG